MASVRTWKAAALRCRYSARLKGLRRADCKPIFARRWAAGVNSREPSLPPVRQDTMPVAPRRSVAELRPW